MDREWFKSIQNQKILQKNPEESFNKEILGQEFKEKFQLPENLITNDNLVRLLESSNIVFSISKDKVKLSTSLLQKHNAEKSIPEWSKNAELRLNRLYVFGVKDFIPVGFWLKLLSRLLIYSDYLLKDEESTYSQYLEQKNGETVSDTLVLDAEHIKYTKDSFIYFDEEVFFSVKFFKENDEPVGEPDWLFDESNDIKDVAKLSVEVSCKSGMFGHKLFSNILEHIDIVLEESNISTDYLSRISRCPACVSEGSKTQTLFKTPKYSSFCRDTKLECTVSNNHPEMKLFEIFPDLTFEDCPDIVLLPCSEIGISRTIYENRGVKLEEANLETCTGFDGHVALKAKKGNKELTSFLDFKKEIKMMLKLTHHPHIVTFIGIINQFQEGRFVMVMDNEESSLSSFLKDHFPNHFNRTLLYRFSFQIADAISYMHWLNIYHRDLKPANVLYTRDNVKLADFDTACYANSQGLRKDCGTHSYQAPEMLQNSSYTSLVDIYGFGLILYCMLTFHAPFKDVSPLALKNIMKTEKDFKKAFEKSLELSNKRMDAICLEKLMKRCTEYDPEKRKVNAQCLVFLLQNPCFQLLMNHYKIDSNSTLCTVLNLQQRAETVSLLTSSSLSDNTNTINLEKISFDNGICPYEKVPILKHSADEQVEVIDARRHKDDENVILLTIKIENNFHTIIAHKNQTYSPDIITKSDDQSKEVISVTKMLYNCHGLYMFYKSKDNQLHVERAYWPPVEEQNLDGNLSTVKFKSWDPQCEDGKYIPLDSDADMVINDTFMFLSSGNNLLMFDLNRDGKSFFKIDSFELKSYIKHIFLHEEYLLLTFKDNTTFVTLFNLGNKLFIDIEMEDNREPITAFCEIHQTLWLGTKDGFIYVVSNMSSHRYDMERFKPYESSVLSLTPFSINQSSRTSQVCSNKHNDCNNCVASYGKRLNKNAFKKNYRTNRMYPSEHEEFLLDRNFVLSNEECEESSEDLLLLWNAPNGENLKKLSMESFESNKTSERLKDIRSHREFNNFSTLAFE